MSHSYLPCTSSFHALKLRRRIVLDDRLDLLLICDPVLLEQVVGLCLCGTLRVDLIQQELNSQQNLLDGDGGLPSLFFVEDAETDGAGRVDVGVEERWREFALGWFGGVFYEEEGGSVSGIFSRMWITWRGHTVRKDDFELEQTALPNSLVLARDGAFPALEVEGALGSFERSRDEAEGVIFAPLFAAEM